MKIKKEDEQTIIDGEKENFVYIQHPRDMEGIFEIDANNITIKDFGLICGVKYGLKNIQPDDELDYYELKFVRRIVILYKFIKWLYKK